MREKRDRVVPNQICKFSWVAHQHCKRPKNASTKTFKSFHHCRKKICTVQHSFSNVIPWINLVQQYTNISHLNDCIRICRFIRNFGLCLGIAYSKESEVCLIAVLGNYDDEVFLNEGYHFLMLNNCSKDRENERADNNPPELHVLPILDE
ncbi:hypothetical protein Tsp_12934, partial [Trichinella spiralis]